MAITLHRDGPMLKAAAVTGYLGAAALVVSNVWGSIVVPDHDWIADTVSDLAAGRYEYIQDIGLYGYALGLMSLALALSHLHTGHSRWSLGVAALGITALLVTIIGARNEYGDRDSDGVVVHIYLVYAMGATFTVAFAALAEGLDAIRPRYRAMSYGLALLWAVGAVIFFVLPTEWDGLWERGLGVLTILWVVTVSHALWSLAQRG